MRTFTVKDSVTNMVRNELGPAMKSLGFRRSGRVFWRDGEDVCHVVTIAMSPWGSRSESSFDVYLGVFWHRVAAILKNESVGKMPPPDGRCTFKIGLRRLAPRRAWPSWDVTPSSDYAAIGRALLKDLKRYAVPWFTYRSELRFALDNRRYGRPARGGQELLSFAPRVVFMTMLGQRHQAIGALREYATEWPAEAKALAKQIGLSLSERK